MGLLNAFILLAFLSIIIIPFAGSKVKGIVAAICVITTSIISSIASIDVLSGNPVQFILAGSYITGVILVKIDALSAWFILTINFTFITGVIYGAYYMREYAAQKQNLSLHWICFILTHSALITICSLQNSFAFLIAWEIMALSAFIVVIFEHNKQQTLKAGINYLIQSHISILFLALGFIWVVIKTHSFNFEAIRNFSESNTAFSGFILMMCFFAGFAIKAGFVPFHTWLPYAHPAAPSHVSGVMSGVIIKIGIYGILRMLFLIKSDYTAIGYIILIISLITGLYGVILAILQHNLKRLLAYHSIENIGIIGIGIGIGCNGLGDDNIVLASVGFAGALLHTLNHSLFKSLLFYSAGNIYHSTHTMNIELLGGIGKKMPQTALLFLVGSVAICGLPPFNGFISEFLIYSSLFTGMSSANLPQLLFLIFSVLGLALIGGLAIICFTKAFGTIFLGHPRLRRVSDIPEHKIMRQLPMYMISLIILGIGIFPKYFLKVLAAPVSQFTEICSYPVALSDIPGLNAVTKVGYASFAFLILAVLIFIVRSVIVKSKPASVHTTWGCGYVGDADKTQYSASSFIRQFRKLAEPMLSVHKFKQEIAGIFPGKGWHETHPKDKIEEIFIHYPLKLFRHFLNKFAFLQSGNPQLYVLYGVVFITLIIGIPMIIDLIKSLIEYINLI